MSSTVRIRPIAPKDREPLSSLLNRTSEFTPDEVACALELIDGASTPNHPDYQALTAEFDGQVVGYICFGPTPMTHGTFDLYWVAADAARRGKGIGRALVQAMEDELRQRQARLVRVETSSQEAYGATRRFYLAIGYEEEARIRDFYKAGDDLILFTRRFA
jgi:ribosomal protein S18 acetylase RimI-like enzyme